MGKGGRYAFERPLRRSYLLGKPGFPRWGAVATTIDYSLALFLVAWDWVRAPFGRRQRERWSSSTPWAESTPLRHSQPGRGHHGRLWGIVAAAGFAGLTLLFATVGQATVGGPEDSPVIVVRAAAAADKVVVVAATSGATTQAMSAETAVEAATEEPTAAATEAVATDTPAPRPVAARQPAAEAAAAEPAAPVATAVPLAAPAQPAATAVESAPVPRTVYTAAEVRAFASQAGWPEALLDDVVTVARCESGFAASANSGGGPLGLMQIMPSWFAAAGIDVGAWSDPAANLQVARFVYNHEISSGHDGWAAWACKP